MDTDLASAVRDATRRDWRTDDLDPDAGPVRVAMVGLGWWTREQAMPAVADSTLCETTVVVSGSASKAADVRDASDTVERALAYDEFLAGEALDAYDAVYVATPNAHHLPYVAAAAEHDRAVLCEKPLEATVERAERLVEAVDDAGTRLMVAYRMHTDPLVRRAREVVQSGLLGDPALVQGSMTEPILDLLEADPEAVAAADPADRPWRLDPDVVGPGTSVMDIGLYPLNTARFVLDADPVAVTGVARSDHGAFDAVPDERAAFTVTYEGGVLAACTASQNAALGSHLRVTGTRGEVLVEPAFYPWQDRRLRVSADGTTVSAEATGVDQMREEFDYFADRLLADRPFHADGTHGLADVRTLHAVYEACETGERVPTTWSD